MKNLIYGLIIIIAAISATGCKTSEANYKAAYELAKKKENNTGIDSTIYTKIRREARPQTAIIGNDTIAIKAEYVSLTKGDENRPSEYLPYNVVVAQFKQLFNAKSVRTRLRENGYPDAFIVQTREPLYYVVAASCQNPADAKKALEKVVAGTPVPMRDPCPFILKRR